MNDGADGMTDSKHLEEASSALTQWLSPEHCGHLIAAVISKYIALTPEELQEWQASPSSEYDARSSCCTVEVSWQCVAKSWLQWRCPFVTTRIGKPMIDNTSQQLCFC